MFNLRKDGIRLYQNMARAATEHKLQLAILHLATVAQDKRMKMEPSQQELDLLEINYFTRGLGEKLIAHYIEIFPRSNFSQTSQRLLLVTISNKSKSNQSTVARMTMKLTRRVLGHLLHHSLVCSLTHLLVPHCSLRSRVRYIDERRG